MHVKLIRCPVEGYEETVKKWLDEHQAINVKHLAIALAPFGAVILTVVFYEQSGKEADSKG